MVLSVIILSNKLSAQYQVPAAGCRESGFKMHFSKLSITRGSMGHILDTGISCFNFGD